MDDKGWKPLKVVFALPVTSTSSVTGDGAVAQNASVTELVEVTEPAEVTEPTVSVTELVEVTEPAEVTEPTVSVTEPVEVTEPTKVTVQGWTEADIEALRKVLAQDPRPRYQNDPDKVYGMIFNNMDVRFKVSEDVLTVVEIKSQNRKDKQNER